MSETEKTPLNFIEQMIEKDLSDGKNSFVQTRFPPEPNGYLHIGHAKSIVLNFELALKYNGKCNLRFDDTNPEKENQEYVDAIIKDIEWLGYNFGEKALYTSDYFDELYAYAVKLIKNGLAYVDFQTAEEIIAGRTNPSTPGVESPYRQTSVEENLAAFEKMKDGAYEEGACVLRAKVDMTSPNMHMRDPIMYRIKKAAHHRTGDSWCIYPNYDFAHGQSDSIEHVTYSLCTLEFRDHKPLYDWFIDHLEIFPSEQTEFARLNLSYTVVSKRKLLQLVEEGKVTGWDDPRMPTISALRRRGVTPDAIKNFVHKVGVARRDGITDVALLEHSIREDLNKKANRVFGIQNPLKVIITNWPEDKVGNDAGC
jgi:glutaminyl-tRNA synthetase